MGQISAESTPIDDEIKKKKNKNPNKSRTTDEGDAEKCRPPGNETWKMEEKKYRKCIISLRVVGGRAIKHAVAALRSKLCDITARRMNVRNCRIEWVTASPSPSPHRQAVEVAMADAALLITVINFERCIVSSSYFWLLLSFMASRSKFELFGSIFRIAISALHSFLFDWIWSLLVMRCVCVYPLLVSLTEAKWFTLRNSKQVSVTHHHSPLTWMTRIIAATLSFMRGWFLLYFASPRVPNNETFGFFVDFGLERYCNNLFAVSFIQGMTRCQAMRNYDTGALLDKCTRSTIFSSLKRTCGNGWTERCPGFRQVKFVKAAGQAISRWPGVSVQPKYCASLYSCPGSSPADR